MGEDIWSGDVNALAVSGDALFAGGEFTIAGSKVSGYFALWQPRVNVSTLSLAGNPGDATLGDDVYGFYKPALITDTGTTVSYTGGLPVDVTMERAPEIHCIGRRVNGAFTLSPGGVTFGGTGATLRVEFSEDDVALFGGSYTYFRAVRLVYPPGYPASKEAVEVSLMSDSTPIPWRTHSLAHRERQADLQDRNPLHGDRLHLWRGAGVAGDRGNRYRPARVGDVPVKERSPCRPSRGRPTCKGGRTQCAPCQSSSG